MSGNRPVDFAQRLYARVPAHYRVRDAERSLPLYALLRVIGTQAANLRRDLDDLWDNFFIETCDEWVVPYLGALLGTRLLPNPVGQTNRMDVWNTIGWRRSRGTPRMLRALSLAITGWPTGFAEFYRSLGWSQNVNHLRLAALLTPDLRDDYALSLLGTATDPWLHAADFKPAFDLDQSPVNRGSHGIGRAGFGTDGRYQIRSMGFFVRRLQVFPVRGGTPAASAPGIAAPADAGSFTFDPLHREVPLFSMRSADAITRAAFAHAPGEFLGTDIAVRRQGIALATAAGAPPLLDSSEIPFSFGGRGAGLALHPVAGMRLLAMDAASGWGGDFVVTAVLEKPDTTTETLGALGTRAAIRGLAGAFHVGGPMSGSGVLRLEVSLAGPGSFWPPPAFSQQRAARFPGAVITLCAAQVGALRESNGLHVYLPSAVIGSDAALILWVADDGSTYIDPSLDIEALARSGEGQVFPPASTQPSNVVTRDYARLLRAPGGMVVTDPSRFGTTGVVFVAEVFTGVPQLLGGIPTVDASGTLIPELELPAVWPALTFAANPHAADVEGLLVIRVQPIPGGAPPARVPPTELIVNNRAGRALLVYLPELADAPPEGVRFFVADDGSGYFYPPGGVTPTGQLVLARAACGQVWPIAGRWPLQQRIAVACDLDGPAGAPGPVVGQLGIDPERGRFALPDGDPARIAPVGGGGTLSVDYNEAFADRVGALNFDRQIDPAAVAARIVASSGDAEPGLSAAVNAPVHLGLAEAVAAAHDGEIIEIADSATYAEAAPVILADASVRGLTIRARDGERPCLTFYAGDGSPLAASLMTLAPLDQLGLSGLLISGGPVVLHATVEQLQIVACTLDPASGASSALISDGPPIGEASAYLLCRCVTGPLCLGLSVQNITIANSVVDAGGGFAIIGAEELGSPPFAPLVPDASDATVQLERVTVLGRVFCDVLNASKSLLDGYVAVADQQSGCIRFSRYEQGSILPRRYRCVPTEDEASAWSGPQRLIPPKFNARRYGRPDYVQLAASCPAAILTASEAGAEVGAFASGLNSVRLGNLRTKLQEFTPVGLSAAIIAVT